MCLCVCVHLYRFLYLYSGTIYLFYLFMLYLYSMHLLLHIYRFSYCLSRLFFYLYSSSIYSFVYTLSTGFLFVIVIRLLIIDFLSLYLYYFSFPQKLISLLILCFYLWLYFLSSFLLHSIPLLILCLFLTPLITLYLSSFSSSPPIHSFTYYSSHPLRHHRKQSQTSTNFKCNIIFFLCNLASGCLSVSYDLLIVADRIADATLWLLIACSLCLFVM